MTVTEINNKIELLTLQVRGERDLLANVFDGPLPDFEIAKRHADNAKRYEDEIERLRKLDIPDAPPTVVAPETK